MKTFLIIMLAISLTVPAFSKTEKKLSPVIGYYVVFQQKGEKPQKVKTIYLAEVCAAAELVFPGNCTNFDKELRKSPYYEICTYKNYFNVELRLVTPTGRFKRIGVKQFEAIITPGNHE